MKQKNEGSETVASEMLRLLKIFQPMVSVYTYVKGFLMEEGKHLFNVSKS